MSLPRRAFDSGRRLREAVRGLDEPPRQPAWNAGELADALDPDEIRPAAVLVPFVRRPQGLSLLFTQRALHLRHHAGQVSFPGGGLDPDDAGPVAAALRETHEETGIEPALVEPFGYLDCLHTVSGYHVTPVAGFVAANYRLQLETAEVAAAFEVPLDFILDPASLRHEHVLWRGRERDVFAFEWQGRRIWGATAAILKNLLDRLEAA